MLKVTFVATVLLTVASTAAAQNGWSRLGAAAAGDPVRQEQERMQGAMQVAELQAAIASARANRAALERADLEARWQSTLTKIWEAAGLDNTEALHVAAAFRIAPEQSAILDRVRRDGVDSAIEAAKTAYRDYNYQLANQLMVAGYIVTGETRTE